ncbi:general transcription factor [Lithospermum erythrorhizon]|uniref:General transcription factor n=1 Tax=Lithospermum erythrorhizon TaxID=34254 RepID=A0AAV3PXR4_LITER
MKQSQDPFEAALMEQEKSPSESPINVEDNDEPRDPISNDGTSPRDDDFNSNVHVSEPPVFTSDAAAAGTSNVDGKLKEDEEDEEEENMDAELRNLSSAAPAENPDSRANMQAMLSQFTEEQMNRYESFRRSGFQRANMKRLLASITGSSKISVPMTIVISGIAKMFVGELVETARVVMSERRESGPIRPCHIRESYRRLKLEGKIPKRSVSRLFR